MSSGIWRPLCLGLNVLKAYNFDKQTFAIPRNGHSRMCMTNPAVFTDYDTNLPNGPHEMKGDLAATYVV